MKRKKRTRNDIAMAYRIESLPGRVPKVVFYQTLLDFLNGEIAELPEGWEVTWLWRNSRKSKLRSDTIENAVSNSRGSFMTLMQRRLKRDLDNLRPSRDRWRKAKKSKKRRGKARRSKKSRRVSKVRRKKS